MLVHAVNTACVTSTAFATIAAQVANSMLAAACASAAAPAFAAGSSLTAFRALNGATTHKKQTCTAPNRACSTLLTLPHDPLPPAPPTQR